MKTGQSIIVKGKVQGVFYRASTMAEAQRLSVSGWVRNLTNGHVEIEVFGELSQVNKLVDWCKKGPQMARVEELITEEIPYEEHQGFEVKYD